MPDSTSLRSLSVNCFTEQKKPPVSRRPGDSFTGSTRRRVVSLLRPRQGTGEKKPRRNGAKFHVQSNGPSLPPRRPCATRPIATGRSDAGRSRMKKPRRSGAKDSMRAQPTPLPRRCARQARQMPSLRWRLLISGAGGFGIGGSFSPSPE